MKVRTEEQYKSIKVPQWVYENLEQAKLTIARKGTESLPQEVLSPECCPICTSAMEKLELKYSYKKCPHCGYMQQDFKASSNFLKGALIGGSVGLGLSLLFYYLLPKNKKINITNK